MAKRKAAIRARARRTTKKGTRSATARPGAKRLAKRQASARKASSRPTGRKKATVRAATPRRSSKPASPARRAAPPNPVKVPKLDRARRTLNEDTHGVPSSLDLDQHGSAARTGRAEMAQNLRDHRGMTDVSGGDVDVDIEDAYFTGEEAPGGDNPTPDQDIVDDIGKALGVEYDDNEPLKGSDKVIERDKHRWELDPASAEDYKERK
jgi:Family of unknown function (DUF6335)